MNMTEQLKQALAKETERHIAQDILYDDVYVGPFTEKDGVDCAIHAVDWYRNNVWHKASHDDIPQIDNAICLIYKKDFYPEVDYVKWSAAKRCFKYGRYGDVNFDFVDKWAYLEDLLSDENI